MRYLLMLSLLIANISIAKPVDDLTKLLLNTNTMQADFSQEVRDLHGNPIQKYKGEMFIEKPQKFRWEIKQPEDNETLLVYNGKKLYNYDVPLEQVTVQKLENNIDSPLKFLLTGNIESLPSDFNVLDLKTDGFCNNNAKVCFKLKPKQQDSTIDVFEIGFSDGKMQALRMIDGLGQVSDFIFFKIKLNEKVNPEKFKFKVPSGVDVIGE